MTPWKAAIKARQTSLRSIGLVLAVWGVVLPDYGTSAYTKGFSLTNLVAVRTAGPVLVIQLLYAKMTEKIFQLGYNLGD